MEGKGREEDLKLDSSVASPSFTLATGLQTRGFLEKRLQQPELWGFCCQHTFERRACQAQTGSASSQASVGVASCWPSPGRKKLRSKLASSTLLVVGSLRFSLLLLFSHLPSPPQARAFKKQPDYAF